MGLSLVGGVEASFRFVAPAATGSYVVSARATDNTGLARDAQQSFTVIPAVGQPPAVNLLTPTNNFSVGADWWSIRKNGTIQSLALVDLVNNYTLFPGNFIRDAAGNLVSIDQRWVNAGESITKGVDINARANGNVLAGKWTVALEGAYLMEKKSRLIASAPFPGAAR